MFLNLYYKITSQKNLASHAFTGTFFSYRIHSLTRKIIFCFPWKIKENDLGHFYMSPMICSPTICPYFCCQRPFFTGNARKMLLQFTTKIYLTRQIYPVLLWNQCVCRKLSYKISIIFCPTCPIHSLHF